MKHLSWTLLGVTELDVFNAGVETPSDHLAQILYAVFIIAALVLLVNMMIAVLSNTYERVQVILLPTFLKKKRASKQHYRLGKLGASHSKTNSGLNFRKFSATNGATFSGISGKADKFER